MTRPVVLLIGSGAHAKDIAADMRDTAFVQHNSDYRPLPDLPTIIAINDPHQRAKIAAEIGRVDLSWIHSTAIIGPDCFWGIGTHINYGASLTRTHIGSHCTISPGATICGDVAIGHRTLIGAGATVCDRTFIGDYVTIGAGTIILPETVIPDGTTWVGNPARQLRDRPTVNDQQRFAEHRSRVLGLLEPGGISER